MSDWVNTTIGGVLPFRYGKGLSQRMRTHSGKFHVVSSAGVIDTHDEALTGGPTVVVGRKGSIGTVYYCPDPVFPIDTTFFVEGSDRVDTRFAFYLLSTLPLSQMNNDSAVPGLNRVQAENLEILLPPIDEQRSIAATLGALDDKIESNRRLVEIIPQLIRAMVVRSLPASPRQVPVAHLATFVNGGAYTKGASGVGRIVIRIAELNSGVGGSTVYNDIDVPDDKIARPGDILMSWSGSLGVYRWKLDEAIVNQHIFKVLPSDGYPAWFVHDRLDAVMSVFRGIAQDKATTMGHIQRGHLESTMIEVPMPDVIQRLDEIVAPLWKLLLLAEREVVDLTALRDALLPELLSGRIQVPAAGGAAI